MIFEFAKDVPAALPLDQSVASMLRDKTKAAMRGDIIAINLPQGRKLVVNKNGHDVFSGWVEESDETAIYNFKGLPLSAIAIYLISSGIITELPNEPRVNAEHISDLQDMIEKLTIAYTGGGLPYLKDTVPEDPNQEFKELSDLGQIIVRQLEARHQCRFPATVSDFREGAHIISITGSDGVKYNYILTRENKLMFANSYKSVKLCESLEEVMFKSAGTGQNKIDGNPIIRPHQGTEVIDPKTVQNVRIVPDIASFDDTSDNGMTGAMKMAIMVLARDQNCTVYSIENNNDMSYTVTLETFNGSRLHYRIDRDGAYTKKSRTQLWPTADELFKSDSLKSRKKE